MDKGAQQSSQLLPQGRFVPGIAGQKIFSAGAHQLQYGVIAGGADHRREVGGFHLLLPDAIQAVHQEAVRGARRNMRGESLHGLRRKIADDPVHEHDPARRGCSAAAAHSSHRNSHPGGKLPCL